MSNRRRILPSDEVVHEIKRNEFQQAENPGNREDYFRKFHRLLATHSQSINSDGRRSDRTTKFKIVGDFRNVHEHIFEIAGYGDLFNWIGKFTAGYPKTGGSARGIAGDKIHPHAKKFCDIETVFHIANKLLGRFR